MSEPATVTARRFSVGDPEGAEVPCTVLYPESDQPLPVCSFLYGGGGSAETLLQLRPVIEQWWAAGDVAPMVIASAEVGPMSFYLEDPSEGSYGETIVAERLLSAVRELLNVREDAASTGLLGISMGGYGALKIGLARPETYGVIAAMQPMVEPGFAPGQIPLRNRFHYSPDVPERLLGALRDAALYEADHPAGRAVRNAEALREHRPSIYIEVGDDDLVNACDGAEFVHRVLWNLDIQHEYRLLRGADHGGPTFLPRLKETMAWTGRHLSPEPARVLDADEQRFEAWLEGGMEGAPPSAVSPVSPLFLQLLRTQLKPARDTAAEADPTVERHFGRLPPAEPPED